jgi:hypothetical protein
MNEFLLYVVGMGEPLRAEYSQIEPIIVNLSRQQTPGIWAINTKDGRTVTVVQSAIAGWERVV